MLCMAPSGSEKLCYTSDYQILRFFGNSSPQDTAAATRTSSCNKPSYRLPRSVTALMLSFSAHQHRLCVKVLDV